MRSEETWSTAPGKHLTEEVTHSVWSHYGEPSQFKRLVRFATRIMFGRKEDAEDKVATFLEGLWSVISNYDPAKWIDKDIGEEKSNGYYQKFDGYLLLCLYRHCRKRPTIQESFERSSLSHGQIGEDIDVDPVNKVDPVDKWAFDG